MTFVHRPADYPSALAWPPAYNLDRAVGEVIREFKLTAPERKLIEARQQVEADGNAELARLDPKTIKRHADTLLERQRKGEDIPLADIREAAGKLATVDEEMKVTRTFYDQANAAADRALLPTVNRFLDALAEKFEKYALAYLSFSTGAAALFTEPDETEANEARFARTREVIADLRRRAEAGAALHQLRGWGLASRDLPPPTK